MPPLTSRNTDWLLFIDNIYGSDSDNDSDKAESSPMYGDKMKRRKIDSQPNLLKYFTASGELQHGCCLPSVPLLQVIVCM